MCPPKQQDARQQRNRGENRLCAAEQQQCAGDLRLRDGRERVEQPRQVEQQRGEQQQQRGKPCGGERCADADAAAAKQEQNRRYQADGAADFDCVEQAREAAFLCRQSTEQFRQALPDGEGISPDELRERVNDLVAGGGAAKIRIHAGLEAFIRHDKIDHFALIEGGRGGGQFLRVGAEKIVPINRKFRLIGSASAGQGGKRSVGEGKIRLNLGGVPLDFVLTFFFAG